MKRFVLTALLVAAALVGLAGPAQAARAARSRWVLGYYVGYQRNLMPPAQIEWTTLTHLVVGPVNPRSNGTLDTTFDIDATRGPALAKHLGALAKQHGVVPMLMIGGAGDHDQWLAAAKNHLDRLVGNLVHVMRSYGYRGLDLDWEPIDPADQPHVSALVSALRQRLPKAVLTMPVGPTSRTFPDVPRFYGSLAGKLDRLDVMTYGMAYGYQGWRSWHSSALTGTGAHTPTAVDVSVKSYRAAGVPAAKLGVGIGFYGMCWTGKVTGPRQSLAGSHEVADDNVMSWTHIRAEYYRAANYHYDTKAQAPYLGYSNPHGPQHCTYVSYEDSRSIIAKGTWARAHGLGSLIVWTINQGHLTGARPGHRDPLLATARRAFDG
jgi:chitinase